MGMGSSVASCGNLQNTDRYYHSSFSTIQVSGVGCQEDTETNAKKTACDQLHSACLRHELRPNVAHIEGSRVDDSRKKTDGFLPFVIVLLTPDT